MGFEIQYVLFEKTCCTPKKNPEPTSQKISINLEISRRSEWKAEGISHLSNPGRSKKFKMLRKKSTYLEKFRDILKKLEAGENMQTYALIC